MAHRDGDGWIDCQCGGKHWGLFGAAGLVLVRDQSILLQHRAPWVHNGDTWGIPGGARDSHETPLESALREANEEIGIDIKLLSAVGEFVDDHITWSYHTIIAKASPELIAHEMNDESLEVKWIPIAEIENQKLHPSFANTWPKLREKLTF
jgi:8-oxo-dGTP diphosphatase